MNIETNEHGLVDIEEMQSKLTPEQFKAFSEWMCGQTMSEHGIYPWDIDRWIKQGMKTEQGADWD